MILAYLQGGPADLQKHALDVERPPETLLIAHMEPVKVIATDVAPPVKKLRYRVLGGWANNVTYVYDGEVQEIVTK